MTSRRHHIRFTETQVKRTTAKPGQRVEYADPKHPSLILRVSHDKRNGRISRIWLFRERRLRHDGAKRGGKTLGVFTDSHNSRGHRVLDVQQAIKAWKVESGAELEKIGLQEEIRRARERLRELLTMAEQDITLRKLFEDFYSHKQKSLKRPELVRSPFDSHVPKAWFEEPASEIGRVRWSKLAFSVAKEKPMAGNKILERASQMYKYGITRGWVHENPLDGIEKPAKARKVKRVLSAEEVGIFWAALEYHRRKGGCRAIQPVSIDAIQFDMCIGQRRVEAIFGTWPEINGSVFTIPPTRIKTSDDDDETEDHTVHLGPLALRILARRRSLSKNEHIFESSRVAGQPINENSLTTTVSRLSRKLAKAGLVSKPFTPHDFRRTMATHLTQYCRTRVIVVKWMMNHELVTDAATAAYVHPQLQEEAREGWLAWDGLLQGYIQAGLHRGIGDARPVLESIVAGRRPGPRPRVERPF